MSIIRSLKLLFDPIEYRAEVREQARKQKVHPPHGNRAPVARCRTCGFTGPTRICLSCLTPTMDPVQ